MKHFTRQLDIVIITAQYCQEEQRYDVEKCLRKFLTTTHAILATRIVIIINYGNIYIVDIPANQYLIPVKIVTCLTLSLIPVVIITCILFVKYCSTL